MSRMLKMMLFLLGCNLLVGCSRQDGQLPTGTPPRVSIAQSPVVEDPGVQKGLAGVETVEVLVLESFPVRVNVKINGYLPDGCTELGEVSVSRNDNVFEVVLPTIRPEEMMCTQALKPFEKVVGLDVVGLKKGTYTVLVHGQEEKFELEVDNEMVGE